MSSEEMNEELLESMRKQLAELQALEDSYSSTAKTMSKEIEEFRQMMNEKVRVANDALTKAREKKNEIRRLERK